MDSNSAVIILSSSSDDDEEEEDDQIPKQIERNRLDIMRAKQQSVVASSSTKRLQSIANKNLVGAIDQPKKSSTNNPLQSDPIMLSAMMVPNKTGSNNQIKSANSHFKENIKTGEISFCPVKTPISSAISTNTKENTNNSLIKNRLKRKLDIPLLLSSPASNTLIMSSAVPSPQSSSPSSSSSSSPNIQSTPTLSSRLLSAFASSSSSSSSSTSSSSSSSSYSSSSEPKPIKRIKPTKIADKTMDTSKFLDYDMEKNIIDGIAIKRHPHKNADDDDDDEEPEEEEEQDEEAENESVGYQVKKRKISRDTQIPTIIKSTTNDNDNNNNNNSNNNSGKEQINQINKLKKKKYIQQQTPINQSFAKLLESCRKADKSQDMELLITKRLIRYYKTVHPDFVNSKSFCKTAEMVAADIDAHPSLVYLKINGILEELNIRRKSGSTAALPPSPTVTLTGVNNCNAEEYVPNDGGSTGNERKDKQIRRLNHALYVLKKKIALLDESDVNLDDDINSTYMIVERYKKRAFEVYEKLCDITGESKHAHRLVRQPIKFNGTNYPEFNRTIQAFVNRTHTFPDMFDVLRCLEHCNTQYSLNLSKDEIRLISQDAFIKIGKLLQKRRQTDLYQTVDYFTGSGHDPAVNDKELQAKLTSNQRYHSRISDVINKFAAVQDRSRIDGCSKNATTTTTTATTSITTTTTTTTTTTVDKLNAEENHLNVIENNLNTKNLNGNLNHKEYHNNNSNNTEEIKLLENIINISSVQEKYKINSTIKELDSNQKIQIKNNSNNNNNNKDEDIVEIEDDNDDYDDDDDTDDDDDDEDDDDDDEDDGNSLLCSRDGSKIVHPIISLIDDENIIISDDEELKL